MSRTHGMARFVICTIAALTLAQFGAPEAFAQGFGGAAGGSGGGARGGKNKPKTTGGIVLPQAPQNAGNQYSKIVSYVPQESDDKSPTLIGLLTVLPFETGKTLKLRVHNRENFTVSFAGQTYKPEDLGEVLKPGLYVTVGWGLEEPDQPKGGDDAEKKAAKTSKKSGQKQLNTITFDEVPVEGKVAKIEGEIITVRARPLNNVEWPHVQAEKAGQQKRTPNATAPAAAKQKAVAIKSWKVKALDHFTKFKNAAGDEITMGELQVGDPVEAKIVLGTSEGCLMEMQVTTGDKLASGKSDRTIPPPPPPDRGKPRGGAGG